MNITDAINSALKIKDEFLAGRPLAAWEEAIKIQQFLIDAGRAIGFQAHNPADVTTLKNCLQECCDINLPVSSNPETGAIGDGQLIKKFLELLLIILPLIVK